MNTSYIKSTVPLNLEPEKASKFLPAEDMYFGMTAHKSLQNLYSIPSTKADELEVKVNYEPTRKLYVEAMKQLKQRFSF